jgi:signal transduction histidine kinase
MMPEDASAVRALAQQLARQRTAVLDTVRDAITRDPEISTSRTLARQGFLDHLPELLDALEQRLQRLSLAGADRGGSALGPERIPAARHGRHRWRQGYSLPEAIAEWRHLSACLNEVVESFAAGAPGMSQPARAAALREVAEFIVDGIRSSAEQHAEMQRAEAAERAAELRAALEKVRALERERTRNWRQALHDIRGSLGAVTSASALLGRTTTPNVRVLSQEALSRGLSSLREMLNDLASLARLEAGQEPVRLGSFDACAVLRELCGTLRPLAMDRGLVLEMQGPEALEVEGDATKVRRIAQNLLINALKYTDRGGVWLSWWADTSAPEPRWILMVRDSGPGFDARHEAPMAAALHGARRPRPAAGRAESTGAASARSAAGELAPEAVSRPDDPVLGEGIGLSIVKQLCELVSASIELETEPGRGTTFRVVFPARYPRP